ncbi:MAG: COX15/CtaA family protein [Pseudomonadales bacterium]|nr:COX15/CtaA family protein [Pseudomonadales bacterium]
MASVFAVVILVMTVFSLWYRRRLGVGPMVPVLCFVLTVVLSVVGINTPDVVHPVVTAINLTGGMLLAVLLLHLLMLQQGNVAKPVKGNDRILTLVGVWLLVVVIASGSWVSGNFAAGQCDGLLACTYPFEAQLGEAFDLSRSLQIQDGRIVVDENQAMIAYTHQWLAIVSAIYVLVVAGLIFARRGSGRVRNTAVLTAGITFGLMLLGVLEVGAPNLFTASVHNALSLVLLLAMIYLYNCLSQKSEDD